MGKFPTSQHLILWACATPGNHVSAGKGKSIRTVKGYQHIKYAMCEAV